MLLSNILTEYHGLSQYSATEFPRSFPRTELLFHLPYFSFHITSKPSHDVFVIYVVVFQFLLLFDLPWRNLHGREDVLTCHHKRTLTVHMAARSVLKWKLLGRVFVKVLSEKNYVINCRSTASSLVKQQQ